MLVASGGTAGHERPGPLWIGGVILGALGCLMQLLVPVSSLASALLFLATAAAAATLIVIAAARMPRGVRGIWWFLAGFVVLTFLADVIYRVQDEVLQVDPFPGPADVLYLAAYASAIVALVRVTRRTSAKADRDAFIDTAIITLALLSAATVFLFAPLLADTSTYDLSTYVALAYPVLDIALVAALVRLLVGVRRLELPLTLVTAAFALTLVADLLYQAMTVYGDSVPGTAVSEAMFLATLVLLAAAATTPNAASIADPWEQPFLRPTSIRVIALTVGVLTAPILTLLVVWPDERQVERLLAVSSIAVILLAVLRIRGLLVTVEAQANQLGRQARTDGLTGLPNRRTLDYEVERVVQQTSDAGQPLTVAMLDLDRFKSFNDQFGHQAGDALLRGAAQAWSAALPPGSFLARYGGEEFALLLPGERGDDAEPILQALRAVTPPERTVSIGYAEWEPGESGYEALNRADRALYAAKAAGRDRIVKDDPDADPLSAEG